MKYTLAELKKIPTLSTGQVDDLKVENGGCRVWLSRCGVADGMEYDNMVTVEVYTNNNWETVQTYQAL